MRIEQIIRTLLYLTTWGGLILITIELIRSRGIMMVLREIVVLEFFLMVYILDMLGEIMEIKKYWKVATLLKECEDYEND